MYPALRNRPDPAACRAAAACRSYPAGRHHLVPVPRVAGGSSR
jgi:hypothetical protein